jgi:adenosylcobinamide kinase / adenosylcobinamide-phosphate guanylyltransferase
VTSVFLLGGARSGKSTLAVQRARDIDAIGLDVTFVVTAEALDDEMQDRIKRHQAERPDHWKVIEAARNVEVVLDEVSDTDFVVVDCVSFWIANLVMDDISSFTIEAAVDQLCEVIVRRSGDTVVVSNEVGLGLVPESALGRAFRDTLGRVNARIAAAADESYFVVAGKTLRLS